MQKRPAYLILDSDYSKRSREGDPLIHKAKVDSFRRQEYKFKKSIQGYSCLNTADLVLNEMF